MEFETIFSLALLALYLYLQFAGRKKRPDQQPNHGLPKQQRPSSAPDAAGEPNEMEAALREIREALGMPSPKPEPRPSLPPARNKPARPGPATIPPPKPVPAARTVGKTALERKASEKTTLEDRFEKRPAFETFRPAISQRTPVRIKAPKSIPEPPVPAPRSAKPTLPQQLRDPKTAREAFILSEVFRPRRRLR